MSPQAEIGQPEGRTQYSDFAEERYDKQRDGGGPLSAGEYAQVVHGYLREWVCMGQCNLYIAAAKDPELKEVIKTYLSDVCDPNVAEMQKLLQDAGYEPPIPLDEHPTSTEPIRTEAIDDRSILLGQWFATRAFMELWHTGAMASFRTDARDAFIRNDHRANRWHVAYHDLAVQKGYLSRCRTSRRHDSPTGPATAYHRSAGPTRRHPVRLSPHL